MWNAWDRYIFTWRVVARFLIIVSVINLVLANCTILIKYHFDYRAVASWLEAPQSEYMLGFVCPDLLLLRIISHGLILWDDVQPTIDWVESHVPDAIKPYCFTKPKPDTQDIDYETMK